MLRVAAYSRNQALPSSLLLLASRQQAGTAAQQATRDLPGGASQAVNTFSSEAAAALAAKKAHLTGAGGLVGSSSRGFGTFAASAPASSSSSAASAAGAAAAQQEKPSLLRRLAQAVAVVTGACMLASGVASADAPEPWQWLFQDSATSTAQAMFDLHHDIMFFLITITILVIYLLTQLATKFHYTKQLKPEKFTHHTTLEVIWTIIPTLIVLSIAVPSLTLIYSLDQHTDRPGLTVKVIGRQWYWSYEMHDHLQQKLVDPERLAAIAEKAILKD
ncbi:cytochrome c oxidase subunit II, protein IIa of split subunit [Dunaliella salina]|uniref:Cytochrome c oxidase polypeptide II n=1 Tax=Dunaliella salina TaxID=3046 RepID=A0ABQ7GVQ6_DUNSA|nr:cytochrome c oxidase subunit II, protein IIa of split subunit [Dunaliella salina]|eukprot:KAF5838683.1 cytochrome c oxidase subunit II, protein IIa of split subunit [Dunaliella salina]